MSHDEWAGWDPNDWAGYWEKRFAVEAAGNRGERDLAATLAAYGLSSKAHYDRVNDAFQRTFGHLPAFSQAALDARRREVKQGTLARMHGELAGDFAPVEGVTLEQWAFVMSKAASGADLAPWLRMAGWDEAKWARVSAEWNARMARDTTVTIATAYGQAFMATGDGPFGAAGRAAAGSMLDPSQRDVAGAEPIPFERWIEITEAQNAASQQGRDPAAVLAAYGMTPADWGRVGGWWSQRFHANAMTMLHEYNALSQKYREKFARAAGGR